MNFNRSYTETHDFLLSVIGGAPYGIIAIDLEGSITIANTQALKHLEMDFSVNHLVEMEILDVVDELQELKEYIEICLNKGRRNFDIEEIQYRNKYLTIRGRKILDGMILTIADITYIKETEYYALNSMLEGQELERKRLAGEIHDGIGPTLSTLKMNMANIEGDISNLSSELGQKFKKSYQIIDEVADDIRSISHNLMPKVLSDFGLLESLESLCDKIEDSKIIDIDFIHSGFEGRLENVTELGLYRICQELINNTLKYAKAKKITLQLIKREDTIQLMYEDNGEGFNINKVSKGIGLMNIQNRAKALAGEVIIDSHPGRGMTATIEIPTNPTN